VSHITLDLTHFEASMLLCALAVAKSGASQFDNADVPLRRAALASAYGKLSEALGLSDE